jgi:HSP20 family protein
MTKDKAVKVEATRTGREPTEEAFSPLVDIYETESEVVLVAEVPGAPREAVSVRVDKGVLTIEADAGFEVPDESSARTYVAFEPGRFFRAFALSDEIDREKITASVANGVLTVHLPKAEAAKSQTIEIKVGD